MKPKASIRMERTGGLYLTAGGAVSSGGRIVEIREMLSPGNNDVKETSIRAITALFGPLSLLVHDSVCACSFADSMVQREMMDRPHAKNRRREICRTKYNPNTPWDARTRKRLGVLNTVSCEKTFRYFYIICAGFMRLMRCKLRHVRLYGRAYFVAFRVNMGGP